MSKRAIVVGIDDYTGIDASGNSNLQCCVSDARSVETLLQSFGFAGSDIVTLTDGAATRNAVLDALNNMIVASAPGDVACLYFSGHGTIEPDDATNPTCERFFESICTATRPFLTDKDLRAVADQLQQSTVNFTVISDSCHSGGMDQEADAAAKYRSLGLDSALSQRIQQFMNTWIPVGVAIPAGADTCHDNVSQVTVSEGGHLMCEEDPSQVFVSEAKMTLIAGCRFWELSYEANGHGLLTQALLDLVNADDFQISYGDLMTELQTRVSAGFQSLVSGIPSQYPVSQTPQLRGQENRMGESFLAPWIASQ